MSKNPCCDHEGGSGYSPGVWLLQRIFSIVLIFPGLFLVSALSGCSQSDDLSGRLLDYRERLERVLEVEFPELQEPTRQVRYPTRKQLQRSTVEFTINWLDFFAIMDCDLNRLVGQRNSSLGKMMTASQRWAYEQEFLVVARQCLNLMQADSEPPDVTAELAGILVQKQKDITNVAWNALWAGPEFQQFMSFREGMFAPGFTAAHWAELSAVLGTLMSWSRAPEAIQPSAAHEALNHSLVTYPFYGRLAVSVIEADRLLRNINAGMRRRLDARAICFNQKQNSKARILRNVLVNVFVVNIQPLLAELNKAQQQWRPLLDGSYRALNGHESEELDDFYALYIGQGKRSLWSRHKGALEEHASLWTELLAQCGMRPGS